jgi:uncharacterized protein (TIGR02271 family)
MKAAVRGAKEDLREKKEEWTEKREAAKEERVATKEERAFAREEGFREGEPMEALGAEKEIRIPLCKEEMDVEKIERESGHVRIHKAIKTEERHVTVPLRREEVVIEHVSAVSREGAIGGDGAFQDRVIDIPLHEEELRVGKHAVVREEVVVRTIAQSFERDATASLRSEDLEIEDTRPLPRAQTSPTGYGAPSLR